MEQIRATRLEMKNEAVLRMKAMNLWETAIRQFDRHFTIMCCMDDGVGTFLPAFDVGGKELMELVDRFERKEKCLVYFIAQQLLMDGTYAYHLLFVPSKKTEWNGMCDFIQNGCMRTTVVFVESGKFMPNYDCRYRKTFGGGIRVGKPVKGGLTTR